MVVFLRLLWRRLDGRIGRGDEAWRLYLRGCQAAVAASTALRCRLLGGLRERGSLTGRVLAPLAAVLILVVVLGLWLVVTRGGFGATPVAGAADPIVMFKNPQTANLWLCDETVGSCEGPGQGELVVSEEVANIPDDTGLGAFEFLIYFSRGVANVSVIEGPFLSSTHRQTECQLLETENWLRFACTSTGGEPGPSGSGVLAYMTMRPDPDLVLRPTAGNGVLVRLLDDRWEAGLADESGEPIPIDEVTSATVLIQALEGDVNYDCRVNVIDEQAVSGRYGTVFGILPYSMFFDLEPSIPDFDIDIKDLQFVYGRDGTSCEEPESPGTATPTPAGGTPATATPTPSGGTPGTPAASPTPGTPSPSATPLPPGKHTKTPTPAGGSPTPGGSPAPGTATPAPVGTLTPTPTPEGGIAPTERTPGLGGEIAPEEQVPGAAEGLPRAGVGPYEGSSDGYLLLLIAALAMGGWSILAGMLYCREAQLSEQSGNTGARKQRPRRSPGLRRGRWP